MKSRLLFGSIILSSLVTQANAATHVYEFASTIQSLIEYDSQTQVNANVASSALTGTMVKVGDVVTGRFSYDDAAQASPFDPDGTADGYLVYSSAVRDFGFSVASSGLSYSASFGPASNIVLSDNLATAGGWDGFSAFSEAAYSPIDYRNANVSLFDPSGKAINAFALPSSLSLSSYAYASLGFNYVRSADGDQMRFTGSLTDLHEVTAVPEPGSFATLALGLALLGSCHRIRRQKAR